MQIPFGTTHVYPPNPLNYNPQPDFFKLEFTHYNSVNEEFLQPMYQLWFWYRGGWVKEKSFCNRFNTMLTLSQYRNLLDEEANVTN